MEKVSKLLKTNRFCWLCGKNMYLTSVNKRFYCKYCESYKDEIEPMKKKGVE